MFDAIKGFRIFKDYVESLKYDLAFGMEMIVVEKPEWKPTYSGS